MARDFVGGGNEDEMSFMNGSGSGALLLLGMILMSISVISMVIFSCGKGVGGGGGGCGGGCGGGG